MFSLSQKRYVLVEGGRNICILEGMLWLTSGNEKICHSLIFSNNMCITITGTKACNRNMDTTFFWLYKIRSDMMEKQICQHWGQVNLDNPEQNISGSKAISLILMNTQLSALSVERLDIIEGHASCCGII